MTDETQSQSSHPNESSSEPVQMPSLVDCAGLAKTLAGLQNDLILAESTVEGYQKLVNDAQVKLASAVDTRDTLKQQIEDVQRQQCEGGCLDNTSK